MKIYAGFIERTDIHLGKLAGIVDDLQIRGNTSIICSQSNSGPSAEGFEGSIIEFNAQCAISSTVAEHIELLEDLGVGMRRARRRSTTCIMLAGPVPARADLQYWAPVSTTAPACRWSTCGRI
jgi:hypothetical protein